MSRLCENVGHLFCNCVPPSSSASDRVVVPRLHGSGPSVAPMTWLEMLGETCNLSSAVDAYLLVASSVQINVVEHAHERGSVWQIIRRKTPPRFHDEFVNPVNLNSAKRDGIFDSTIFVMSPTNDFANAAMTGVVSKTIPVW